MLEGAIDFRRLRIGVGRSKASEQCFFIDACRASTDTLIEQSATLSQVSLGADKALNDLAADDEMGDWRISTNRIQTAVEHVAGPRRYVETYWGASALRSKLTDAG